MKSIGLLFMCLLAYSPAMASTPEEAFSELSWAQIVKGSIQCVEEDDSLEKDKGELKTPPTLELTGMEHDLQVVKKPSFLFFKAGKIAYKLCDSDGGATLAFLYSACMYSCYTHMSEMTRAEKANAWGKIKSEIVPGFALIKSLLKHSLNRLTSANKGSFLKTMNELDTEAVSYDMLYQLVGVWLQKNYGNFPAYFIEVTLPGERKSRMIRGIQKREKGTMGWSPVGNTLHHFSVSKFLEKRLPYKHGVFELDTSRLAEIILAYDIKRSFDQGLHSDFRVIRMTMIDPADGLLTVVEKLVPIGENPKVAVPKNETSRAQKKATQVKRSGKRK